MTIRNLPRVDIARPQSYDSDIPADVRARWMAGPQAAEADEGATISIYAPIGASYWDDDGVTTKRVAGALRRIGNKPVTVAINSPGGDVFEGVAIYNLLREHPSRVDVKVMGIAASAASIIAMAGDTIAMGRGSLVMVHPVWGMVVGNRDDMSQAAELFRTIDDGLVDIYAARTGQDRDAIDELMATETYMGSDRAIELGFADKVDEGLSAPTDDPEPSARATVPADVLAWRRIETFLALQNVPRSERRRLKRELVGGTHDAASTVMPGADLDRAAVAALLDNMRT